MFVRQRPVKCGYVELYGPFCGSSRAVQVVVMIPRQKMAASVVWGVALIRFDVKFLVIA